MEKAMNAELIKVLAVIFIGGLGAYMFLINLAKRIVGKAGSVRGKQNIYLIGAALVF